MKIDILKIAMLNPTTMDSAAGLIADLEGAMKDGGSGRRVEMLRRVTDLFLSDADRLNEQQIKVFDDVLVRLIDRIEAGTLAQLSSTLSDLNSAPTEVVRNLAYHAEVSVAGPVLAKSNRLSQNDLVEIASIRGQGHLLAISGRANLDEALTDVLLKRGDTSVSHALAKNAGARFSKPGYATLVRNAEDDDGLAENLGLRLDIPFDMLRQLLSRATEAVRQRLLKAAPPEMRDKIKAVIATVAAQFDKQAPKPVNYKEAEAAILALNRAGNLNNSAVNRFAIDGNYANVVAAIALLSSTSIEAIEPLIHNRRAEGLIVSCRAAGLSWQTTLMILRNRPSMPPMSRQELVEGQEVFDTLSLSAAQRTIRFWSARSTAKKDTPFEMPAAAGGVTASTEV